MTSPQQDFQAQRRQGIGGSDAAAVVGLDPWRTALDVYREKIGEAEEKPPTPQMMRGRLLEPVVIDEYMRLTGKKVRRQPQRTHPDYPFIIANIDRQILADEQDGTGLAEVKCPNMRMFMRYAREGLPAHYVVQGQHYLGVTGYDWMVYAIFNADLWELVHFEVRRDETFIAGLFEREVQFWKEHVEAHVPPPPVTMAMTAPEGLELPDIGADRVVQRDDKDWQEAAENLKSARELVDTAETVEAQAKARVIELMEGHPIVEGADLRAYYRTQPGRKTFDRKALEATKPLDGLLVAAAIIKWVEKYFPPTQAREIVAGALGTLFNITLPECQVNLAAFERVGKPYAEFRPYFLRPDMSEEE